jgi:hypothetical protein
LALDRPTIDEQYGRATQAGNLQHRAGPCPTDKLAALAWADRRLASPLFRARVANDASQIRLLHDLWRQEVARMAERRRWKILVPAVTSDDKRVLADVLLPALLVREVARISLDHFLFDVCPTCTGRRYRPHRDVLLERGMDAETAERFGDVLSDELCPACGGTGQSEPDTPEYLLPLVRRAIESLHGRYVEYGLAALKRLVPLVRS